MFAAGISVENAAVFLAVSYVIWGFWAITAWGLCSCWRVIRSRPREGRSWELLAATLAPFSHMAMWAAFGAVAPRGHDIGVLGLAGLGALSLIMTLAGPLAALQAADLLPRDATVRARPTARKFLWGSRRA